MTNPANISVLLYDDQFLTRKGMASVIESIPGMKLVSQSDHKTNFSDVVGQHAADLVVMNVSHVKEVKRIGQIRKKHLLPLLVVLSSEDPELIQALIKSGIKGIISKSCSETEIINALEAMAEGNRFYCNSVLEHLVETDLTVEQEYSLTSRELEVLKLIAEGNTTSKIADSLHISVHTVNSHRKKILKKLGLSSPLQLVAFAVDKKLVSIDRLLGKGM